MSEITIRRLDLANKQVDAMRTWSFHFKSGKYLNNLSIKLIVEYFFVLLVI